MRGKKIIIIIFLTGLVAGLIYGSRHFFISKILGAKGLEYSPVISEDYDVNMYYYPRAWSKYLGRSDGPANLALLNPVLLGFFGKISGSFGAGIVVANILFPALIFTAVYLLFSEITKRKKLSVFWAVIFIFSPLFAVNFPPVSLVAAKSFLNSFLPLWDHGLYFSRWEYPQATYFFYALSLYLIFRAVKLKGTLNISVAGVALGIIFYTYFYDWVYIFISLGVLFLLFLFNRKKDEAKIILSVALIALLVSGFYWINFWRLHSLPQFDDIISRMGVEISHQLRLISVWKSYLRIAVLVCLLWVFVKKNRELAVYFVSALLLAYFAAVSIQVVLGFNPQPDHWYRELFLPTALALLLLVNAVAEKMRLDFIFPKKYLPVAAGIFLAVFFALQLRSQYIFSLANAETFQTPHDAAIHKWLSENTPENSVIGSLPGAQNNEISLFTRNKVFLPAGFISSAPTEEIWERTMIIGRIFGLSEEAFARLVAENMVYLFTDQYRGNAFDAYFNGADRAIPAGIYKDKLDRYKKLELREVPGKYRLDYLYYTAGTGEDPKNTLPGILKGYEREGGIIYKL